MTGDDPQVKVLSQYQRCIKAPVLPFLAIRDEYLALTNGDPCAAALLAYFEHLTNLRVRELQSSIAPNASIAQLFAEHGDMLWMTKTLGDLHEALRGIWSEIRIRNALKLLQELGFVEKRQEEKSLDRRARWRFLQSIVQSALDATFRSDASDRGIRCIESSDQVQELESEACIESGDQMIYRQDSYIQESSPKIPEQALPPPHTYAPAREGGGGFSIPRSPLQRTLQSEGAPTPFNAHESRGETPHPPSSAAPPSPPAHVTRAALVIAQRAYEAGRVKTTADQYAAGIVARMMREGREVVPATPARGQGIAGERSLFIVE